LDGKWFAFYLSIFNVPKKVIMDLIWDENELDEKLVIVNETTGDKRFR